MKSPLWFNGRPPRRNVSFRPRTAFFDHLEPRTLLCDQPTALPSIKWSFGDTRTNDYVLSAYSALDSNVGPIGSLDPSLRLAIGARYVVTVADPISHPLQIIAKGATAFDDVLLLSQQNPDFQESGLFQADPGVNFVNDVADKSIAFTLTQGLADAMSDPTHGLVPGYRCGNPFHRGFQRGDLVLTSGAPAAKDASDPGGDSISDATPLSLDAAGGGLQPGSIGKPGVVDVYRFVAPVSGHLTVTQRAAPGSALDSVLFAYDASGGMIGQNGEGGGGKDGLLSFKVNAGSVYYVQASGFLGSTGDYDLGFATDPLGSPAGGGTQDLQPIVLDGLGASDLTGQVAVPGAKHDYEFTATISGRMTITERATAGSPLDSLLTLSNDSGVVIAGDDDGGGGLDSLVTADVVAGQTYRVRAAGLGLSEGEYKLSISTADVGNTVQDAGTVALSSSGSGSVQGHIGLAGGEDLYRVLSPTSGVMTSLLSSDFNGTLTVLDASGNTLHDFDNIGTNGRVSFPVTQGETLYVRVSAYGEETGVFKLFLSVDNSPDTFADAPQLLLTTPGYASQIGEIGLPGGTDMYRFVAPTAGTMVLSMDAIEGTTIDPNLTVFDASLRQLASNDDVGLGRNSRLQLPVAAGQTYYVRAGATGDSIGRYNLTLDLAKPVKSLTNPTIIAVDGWGSGRASGAVGVPGEVETFRFVAPVSGRIGIRLDASPGSHLDGHLEVLDGHGTEIGCNDDGGGGYNSLVTIDEVAGQTYEIRVSGFQTSTGTFDLILGDDYGNDPAHAFPIALDPGGRGSLSGRIDPIGDVDVFRLVAPTSGPLTVALTQPPDGPPIASLSVLDASGSTIASDPSGAGGINRVSFAMALGQTYYIRVAGLGQATGAYDLGLDVEGDPGGSGSVGRDIAPDLASGLADVSGEIVLPGDVGKFLYISPVAGLLVITQTAAPGGFIQGSLTLPDGSASPLMDDATTMFGKGYSRISLNVARGQEVAIEVGGVGTSTGQYLLDLRVLPLADHAVTTTGLLPTDPTQIDPTQQYVTQDDLVASLIGPDNTTIRVVPGSVQYQGAPNASGLFAGGAGLLDTRENGSSPFENGVILTTGDASFVTGPNIDEATSGINAVKGDPDLNRLVLGGTTDASVLTFDFIPTTNVVQLRYVFSSEEYNRFVGSPFNDAFGIFINGVDYARVPGTGSPADGTGDIVSVNSINGHRNSQYFIDNTFSPSGSFGRINVAMNGLTRVLTLTAPVRAGEVNSIKLAIADTVDPRYDSGVFLQANSFRSLLETVPETLGRTQFDQLSRAATDVRASNPGVTESQINFLVQQAIIDGTIKSLGLLGDYLVVPVDPVDFTLTGPGGLKVSSVGGTMSTNVPNAFFIGAGSNELLIVPNASRGEYRVDLVGLGSGNFLFGASFVSASKDVTTNLVQGNLRGGGAESVLDFQNLGRGVQMVTNFGSPTLGPVGVGPNVAGPSGSSPGQTTSTAGSDASAGQGRLSTALNGLVGALTVQISGNPTSVSANPGGASSTSATGVVAVASASPAQPVSTKIAPGNGSNPGNPPAPDEQGQTPDGRKSWGRAAMGWATRILGFVGEFQPGLGALRALIEVVRYWLPMAPQSSIEGPPSGEIPQDAEARNGQGIFGTPTGKTLLPVAPEDQAMATGSEGPEVDAEDPPSAANFAVLALAIAPFHWIHRRAREQSGRKWRRA